jgi:Predicted integral membrane protein
MASIIPGYKYDIFISYRQKDNKYDGWVTEFVNNMKRELEATFKEDVSVYTDINPHDGLLETHDVNASLKEKLKCLIFIPIISRTYCDPKSFAWEHEFKTFVEQASQDQFGLKVKLSNSNVASRVLPVRIHDLDINDIKLCESIIGGVLRGIDFIYKSAGVNRPLRSKEDNPHDNLNHTNYRDQINKVANAIKEIILGLKTEPVVAVKENAQRSEPSDEVYKEYKQIDKEKPAKLNKRKLLLGVSILAILLIATVLAYSKIFKRDTLDKLRSSGERISIAVMPFQNMTNDTTWNVWQDGIQINLITSLSNSEELKVRQIESIHGLLQSKGLTNYASITPSVASTISQKLDANVFIQGSINQGGSKIRVNAQLIDSKTEESFKSFQIDGTAENILHIIDSLSVMVKNFLIISILEKEVTLDIRHILYTNSAEAYRYFIYGDNAFWIGDFPTSIKLFSQAIAIDSTFTLATLMISMAYVNQNLYDQGKKWCLKAYKNRDGMAMQYKILTNWVHAIYFETPYEEIKYLKQLQEFDDQLPFVYWQSGGDYNYLHQFDKAIPEFETALEIYKKWGSKPSWVYNYTGLGYAYHKTGQYKKEKSLYKKAELDFPDDPKLVYSQAVLSLTEGDTVAANRYIEKYISVCKDNSDSEAKIMTNLASIYSESGILNKAEEYYRKALPLEPEKPDRLNNLAYFLIDKDRNINEGLELIDKVLGLSPDDFNLVHTKGWGLYKQGKYKEALELLEKSWDLKPYYYDYAINRHIEEVKKAITNQK